MFYLYKISNLVNDKVYVGQTSRDLKQRFAEHKKLHSDCKHLNRAMKKYGIDSFNIELITVCHTQSVADTLEIYFIDIMKSVQNGYNIRGGGSRGKLSAETKRKISIARQGIIFSDETKKKLSLASTGKTYCHTSEAKLKISLARKGKHFPKRKPMSEEQKKKISDSRKGMKFSDEHKKNLSLALKGKKYSQSKSST
jgi:predicted GIY-YIG superfamily endonuclease